MKRIKLTVAYDGTDYCGWQIQPNGITVEKVLNRALSRLTGEDIAVTGASRTDAGVHAVVVKSEEVAADWHPRYQESVKTYAYHILNREMPDPVRRKYVWHVNCPLDLEKMRTAAEYLTGEHDFKSFCSIHTGAKTTVRTIYSMDVERSGEVITIRVSGNGFLYNMVRIITGTLVEAGRGFRQPESVKELLDADERGKAGPTAPAQGLLLESIEYR